MSILFNNNYNCNGSNDGSWFLLWSVHFLWRSIISIKCCDILQLCRGCRNPLLHALLFPIDKTGNGFWTLVVNAWVTQAREEWRSTKLKPEASSREKEVASHGDMMGSRKEASNLTLHAKPLFPHAEQTWGLHPFQQKQWKFLFARWCFLHLTIPICAVATVWFASIPLR